VVAAVVLSLWLMPTAIMRSTAYASTIAVLAAGVASVLVLGFLLSLFGAGMATGDGLLQPAARPGLGDRVTAIASRWPVVTVGLAILVFGGVSLVALVGLNTGETTAESLPTSAASRQVAGTFAQEFAVDEVDGPFVIGPNIEFGDAPAQLAEYTSSLSSIGDVARTDSTQGSYAAGVAVDTPEPLTARLASDQANLVRAPLSVPADSTEAQATLEEMAEVAAPFRADIGGTTVRHMATAAAVDARAPFLVAGAVLAILLLVAWLLHGWRMSLRLAVAAVLSASGSVLVVRLGFVDGLLTDLLGSSQVGTLDAFAAPMAWTVGLALVAGWLVLGWGSAREAFDVSGGSSGAVIRSLSATRRTHLATGVLLWLPFLALAVNGWRTQQMIATAVLGAGLLAVTVGSLVVVPALFALAPGRMWPRRVDGSVDTVYPETAAGAWLVGAAPQVIPSAAPLPATAPERATASPAPVEPAADAVTSAAVAAVADTEVVAPTEPEAGDSTTEPEADASSDDVSVRRRRRARWRRTSAAGAIVVATEADQAIPEADQATPEAPGRDDIPGDVPDDVPDDVMAGEAVAPEEPADADLPSPEVAVEPEPEPAASSEEPAEPAMEADTEPPAVAVVEAEAEPVTEPSVDVVAGAVVDEVEPVEAVEDPPEEAEPVAEALVDEVEPVEAVEDPPEEAEPVAAVEVEVPAKVTRPLAAVDVISLTESVIASIEADVPFTTEISSGYVANPSNNLSRVMEAILRDASRRGGDEVLVYGHAAAGRYRWMVVDSGPRADHDPERARTLAEAQRFIRRVGGVVECRPEGDFNVFVVEIPMAS
jgi:hypothetical protein